MGKAMVICALLVMLNTMPNDMFFLSVTSRKYVGNKNPKILTIF